MCPSLRHETGPSEASDPAAEQSTDLAPGDLLELLADEYVQLILERTASGPKAARELADASGASRATVYRRLNRLVDAGLLTARMEYDADGHHRKVFRPTLETATVALEDGISVDLDLSTPEADSLVAGD